MLRAILTTQGACWAAEASHNNQWGVPLTLARMPPGTQFAVIEIGMNHAGEIAPLARLARPHVALITTVERAHVGHLGSIEAVADEKAAILVGLEPGGIAVLPGDSALLPRLRARARNHAVRLFGSNAPASFRLLDAESDAEGCDVTLAAGEARLSLRMASSGRHMAMNAVGAIAAAAALGVDPAAAARALSGFAPLAGRGARRMVTLPDGDILLLDESYNANGASVRAALSVLGLQPRRRVAVLGDMRELGWEGPDEHRALAPEVDANADLLFACGALMQLLFAAVAPERRGVWTERSTDLAPIVAGALRPGDAVLVKGSLGTRMKPIVQAIEALGAAEEQG